MKDKDILNLSVLIARNSFLFYEIKSAKRHKEIHPQREGQDKA